MASWPTNTHAPPSDAPVARKPATASNSRSDLMEGLGDVLQRRRVAHRWSEWRPEVPWMSLYFSVGVWLSLCFVFKPPM